MCIRQVCTCVVPCLCFISKSGCRGNFTATAAQLDLKVPDLCSSCVQCFLKLLLGQIAFIERCLKKCSFSITVARRNLAAAIEMSRMEQYKDGAEQSPSGSNQLFCIFLKINCKTSSCANNDQACGTCEF